MKYIVFCILSFLILVDAVPAFAQPLSPAELENQPIFSSMKEAMINPSAVYRLKIVGKPKMDSLPDELFRFNNLQELTVKNCKLLVLNQKIDTFKHLQYLNLENNRLVALPQTVGNLAELQQLVINRNAIEALPETVGQLTKLSLIDAWDTYLYVLPESIAKLANTLQTIDLRQVALRSTEYDNMVFLLPKTKIIITNICECENDR